MELKFFDSHTHVQFGAYDEDRSEVMARAFQSSVGMVNVGTTKETSQKAVALAHEYENEPVYATVGIHPYHATESRYDPDEFGASEKTAAQEELLDYEYYKTLSLDRKVVGIGECGLDYYRIDQNDETTKQKQKILFIKHIELANEVKKPLMIHCRSAYTDLLQILQNSRFQIQNSSVIHFFSGTIEDAKTLLDLGFSFTFGGVITFARNYDEVIKYIPLDRILSETDAPYVTPAPYRGKRNEPSYVVEVVKKLSEVKSIQMEEMQQCLLNNIKRILKV